MLGELPLARLSNPRQPDHPDPGSPAGGLDRRGRRPQVSLAAANQKLAQLDDLAARRTTIHLGMPDVAGRTVTLRAGPS